jgi:hypothetical protein
MKRIKNGFDITLFFEGKQTTARFLIKDLVFVRKNWIAARYYGEIKFQIIGCTNEGVCYAYIVSVMASSSPLEWKRVANYTIEPF